MLSYLVVAGIYSQISSCDQLNICHNCLSFLAIENIKTILSLPEVEYAPFCCLFPVS